MSASAAISTPIPSEALAAPVPLREDLVATEQKYLGRTYFVLKNPISLAYFRLPLPQYEAAREFDGKKTFQEIVTGLRQKNPYWRSLTEESALMEIRQLADQLAMAGLVKVSGRIALMRYRRLNASKKFQLWDQYLGKILYIKKSLFDPNKILEAIHPLFSWFYSRGFMAFLAVFFTVTIAAVAANWAEVQVRGANFFTLENLFLTWVSFIFVKTIHEFGHGLTCKHFGGEVHEMGFLLILFTPYLYCNVSDAWIFPEKRKRVFVTAAGIFVELILASIATWLWLFTEPGLFNQLCFNTMFICSVSTILFNANPLLKFDGYYMLADILEIPNLKQKCNSYVTAWAQQRILGLNRERISLPTLEVNPWFGIYAVASYIYSWVVVYRISYKLFDILDPYGLNFISEGYVLLFLISALFIPCYRLGLSVKSQPETWPGIRKHVFRIVGILAAAVAIAFLIPWPASVKRGCVIEHSKVDVVAAITPGFLREVYVKDNESVHAGQPIARLENLELETQKKDLELQFAAYEVQQRQALVSEKKADRLMLPLFERMKNEVQAQLNYVNEEISRCTIHAPRDGVVRTAHLKNLIGQYFAHGKVIFEYGTASDFRAIISLDENQARQVTLGQPVTIRITSLSDHLFHGKITAAPVSELKQLTTLASSNLAGGDVPTEVGTDGQIHPSVAYYEAEALIHDSDEILRAGMTGKARIQTGRSTLGKLVWQYFLELINPSLRL